MKFGEGITIGRDMGRIYRAIDSAPLYIRGLVSTFLFFILFLIIKKEYNFIYLTLISLLIIFLLYKIKKYLLIYKIKNEKIVNHVASQVEVQIVFDSSESLSNLSKFIEKRSSERSGTTYELRVVYKNGEISGTLGFKGPESVIEAEVFRAALPTLIPGVRIRRLVVNNVSVDGSSTIEHANDGRGKRAGVIYLGRRLDSPVPVPVYLSRNDIEGHVGVYGSTGSGKTTTLSVISRRLRRAGIDVLVIDWTGEYEWLGSEGFEILDPQKGDLPVDVLSCDKVSWRSLAIEALVRALDLTEPQTFMLQQAVEDGAASLREVYERIGSLPEASKWDREVKRALLRKLGLLFVGGVDRAFQGCKFPEGKGIVVDVSSLRGYYARRTYVMLLLSMLFTVRASEYSPGAKPSPLVVVVDEAHNVSSQIFMTILSESRKYGLHLVYATQSPAIIGDQALLNTNTKIVHSIRSQRDKRVIIDSLGLSDAWMERLDKLPSGSAILQKASEGKPILVEIDAERES